MVRPQARVRKKIIESSSDAEPEHEQRQESKTNSKQVSKGAPSKLKGVTKKLKDQKSNGKLPSNFFGVATLSRKQKVPLKEQQQREQSPKHNLGQDEHADLEHLEEIEDDVSDTEWSKRNAINKPLPTRKRSSDVISGTLQNRDLPVRNQKFLKSSDGLRTAVEQSSRPDEAPFDTRPWTEAYQPRNLEELAVHHKKVADVRTWLEAVFTGRLYQRLLVLKSAAGTGKTSVVSLLANVLGCKINEWRSPGLSDMSSDIYESLSSQFEDFLGRAGRYTGLDIVTSNGESPHAIKDTEQNIAENEKQLVLIEEFPSSTGSSKSALMLFRSTLLGYIASNTRVRSINTSLPSKIVPIVVIISESTISSESSSDNFTAHRLLGPEILNHPGTTVIEFNPVAPTFLSKALKLVLQKHSDRTGQRQMPGPGIIKKLAEVGDLRNAVSTLEFVCAQGSAEIKETCLPQTTKKGRQGRGVTKAIQMDDTAVMTLISLRADTLGLFHAVGKVMYNKRILADDLLLTNMQKPSSDVNIDTLLETTGCDTSTFLSALHENYVQSCISPTNNEEASLASIDDSLTALGNADLLTMSDRLNSSVSARGEAVRQTDLAFHVGVGGLLAALPWPVKRQPVSDVLVKRHGSRTDAHRMYYPTSLKLWRRREEIEGVLDLLVRRMCQGKLSIAPAQSTQLIALGSGHSARQEMLLERLPYLSRILPATASLRREVEQLTYFSGIGAVQDEDEEGNGDDQAAFKGTRTIAAARNDAGLDVEKLVLSDDDIEDDE